MNTTDVRPDTSSAMTGAMTSGMAGETREVQAVDGRDVAIDVVRGLLAVRPLIDALAQPVHLFPVAGGHYGDEPVARSRTLARLETFLNRAASRIGAPAFTMCPDGLSPKHSVFELAVSQRLLGAQAGLGAALSFEIEASDDLIEEATIGSFDRQYFRATIASADGTRLRVYTAGDRQKKAVVLISPCGMPAKLCHAWIDLLRHDYFVITWESRLLFEEPADRDAFAFDVHAQAADLFAVMDYAGVPSAHLMGMCGGAVIGVTAAAARPARVSSLSLWHGDFELGGGCPITKHQKDLKAFMRGVAAGRRQSEQLHRLFSQNTLKNFREEVAHLVLYPYANAELLYRYAKSNGSIMETDVTPLLAHVPQPTIVVTSEDDGTTHPEGSKRVAELLPRATLEIIAHGDHLSLFNAGAEVTQIATSFLARESVWLP
jgi:pimeloyl-ACP methyl ester carboxylesterase